VTVARDTNVKYLLILFIIAVALAPLSHFMPSKRQRQQARMREAAAVNGLFVEFRSLPGSASGRQPAGADSGRVIYYGKRLPASVKERPRRAAWIRDESGWRPLQAGDLPPVLLQDLPGSVAAASIDEGSCGVYWQEEGGEDEVKVIVGVLEAWLATLDIPGRGAIGETP
jgi:hypothetical protein